MYHSHTNLLEIRQFDVTLTQASLSIIYSCKHFISTFIIFYYPLEEFISESFTEYNIQQCSGMSVSPL